MEGKGREREGKGGEVKRGDGMGGEGRGGEGNQAFASTCPNLDICPYFGNLSLFWTEYGTRKEPRIGLRIGATAYRRGPKMCTHL